MHGVNFGNWLLVEKWMSESLFVDLPANDEFGLSQIPQGKERLAEHRNSYIREDDFTWLKQHSIKIIRVPIGFWTIEKSEISHLDRAMSLASKYDIKVLIDFHGAPGSQNGLDHSGQTGEVRWFKSTKIYRKNPRIL